MYVPVKVTVTKPDVYSQM